MRYLYQLISLVARLYPLERGRTFFFGHFVFRHALGRYLQGMRNPVRMKTGFKLHTYDTGDYTSTWFRLYRQYEHETKKLILEHCAPESIFLDLGANLGLFTIGVPHLRQDMVAVGVEPNPTTHRYLQQSIRDNALEKRVHAFEIATGAEDAEALFFTNAHNSGDSGIAVTEHEQNVPVKVRRLDSYQPLQDLVDQSGRRISCVKMDIQGAEVATLRGMRELIAKHQPVLIIELDEQCLRRFGFSQKDLYQEIAASGYHEVAFVENNIVAAPIKG